MSYTDEEREYLAKALYQLYPRKEGKVAGIKKLKKILVDQKAYSEFHQALVNYKKILVARSTTREYTLLFSTFVNGRWEDYLELPDDIVEKSKGLRVIT